MHILCMVIWLILCSYYHHFFSSLSRLKSSDAAIHSKSPGHKLQTSPSHQPHSSPPHQPHSSPSHRFRNSPSRQLHSSPSPRSSLISEPQSHSSAQDQPQHITNGGEDPPINTSLYRPTGPLIAPKHMLTDPKENIINPSFTEDAVAPPNAKKIIPGTSLHIVKRIKSKTPPPRTGISILPKNKHSSLDRGLPTSHTPSDLELFNTLLGARAPGNKEHAGQRIGSPGVNPFFSHPHGNHV